MQEYLGLLEGSEQALVRALEQVAETHKAEPDIHSECRLLASWSRQELSRFRIFACSDPIKACRSLLNRDNSAAKRRISAGSTWALDMGVW